MKILVTFLEKLKIKKRRNLFLLGLTPLFLIGIGITIFDIYYYNRILPGVYASNLLLAGKTRVEAEALLKNQIKTPGTITLLGRIDSQCYFWAGADFERSTQMCQKWKPRK